MRPAGARSTGADVVAVGLQFRSIDYPKEGAVSLHFQVDGIGLQNVYILCKMTPLGG